MLLVMRMLGTRRDRIESAFVPGVTAGNSFQGEPGAAQGSMGLDGLERIVRTGRIETATRPEQRTQDQLVCADQNFQDEAHELATRFQRVARLARKLVAGASRAGNFAATTTSTAGSSCWLKRKLSRTRRRRRFLATALPAVFTATARPTRG